MPKKPVTYHADIIQAMMLGTGDTEMKIDDPAYAWRFPAEGDSWFTIGAIPSSNLLYEIRLKKRAVILNLGYPGDTISNIAQLSANTEFSRRLAHPNWASNWDAILMSGGGNDLIDRAADIIRELPSGSSGTKATDYIDAGNLKAFQDAVQAGFRKIVELRDSAASPSKGKPIIVHTYDYPTPRPSPANLLIVPITKPWMHPVFEKRNVPKNLRIKVAARLLDSLQPGLGFTGT